MEPLGLPRGSVRSLIVFALIVATVVVAIFAPVEAFTAFATLLGVAVRDYFGTRIHQNEVDGPVVPPPAGGYES